MGAEVELRQQIVEAVVEHHDVRLRCAAQQRREEQHLLPVDVCRLSVVDDPDRNTIRCGEPREVRRDRVLVALE